MLAVAGAVRWNAGRAAVPATPGPVGVVRATSGRLVGAADAGRQLPGPRAWAALSTAPAISLPASLAIESCVAHRRNGRRRS